MNFKGKFVFILFSLLSIILVSYEVDEVNAKNSGSNYCAGKWQIPSFGSFKKEGNDLIYIGNEECLEITEKVMVYNTLVEVKSYRNMFNKEKGANTKQLKGVKSNLKNIKDASFMFSNSEAEILDLSEFDTSGVTNMSSMFYNSQATALDLSSFNTSNVTDMKYMFQNSQAKELDLSSFDTSKVTSMISMFQNSQAKELDLSKFDTSKVTSMNFMFENSQAKELDLSKFDTSKVTSMYYMFQNSQATALDLSSFNTSNVTDMKSMFQNSQAKELDLSKFDTSKVTSMSSMFYNSQAKELNLSGFDTSKVTNMSFMFRNSRATELDLSSFDTSKVTNMNSMFENSQAKELDLSSFDTSNITYMISMFQDSQAKELDLSSFDTSNVTYMNNMFDNSQAKELDLSSFDTSNVTYMNSMFQNSQATIGYAKTQKDADKFNSTSGKPKDLFFIVNCYDTKEVSGGLSIVGYNCKEKNVDIPEKLYGENIVSIADFVFKDRGLTSVTIPNSVTDIGESSFSDNEIEKLTLGSSVKNIGKFAFRYNDLKEVKIPNSVIIIGGESFSNNKIIELKLGSSVETIGRGAFLRNEIKEIEIPNSVTAIEGTTFKENKLTKLSLGLSIKSIGNNAFSYNNLKNVKIPDSVTTIDYASFYNNELTELSLGSSVKSIGEQAFRSNELKNVEIPSSVTNIENRAFQNNNIFGIKFKGDYKNIQIGESAFDGQSLGKKEYLLYSEVEFENEAKIKDKNKNIPKKFVHNLSKYIEDSEEELEDGNIRKFEYWDKEFNSNDKVIVQSDEINYKGSFSVEVKVPEGEDDEKIDLFDCEEEGECGEEEIDGETEGEEVVIEGDIFDETEEDPEPVKGSLLAKEVSGDDFKEEEEKVFVLINPNGYENSSKGNPKYENNYKNNLKEEKFTSVNKVYDLVLKSYNVTPQPAKSNQTVKVSAKFCNEGNQNIKDFTAYFKVDKSNERIIDLPGIDRGIYLDVKEVGEKCIDIEFNYKLGDSEVRDEVIKSNLEGKIKENVKERDLENNKKTGTVDIENPNASIYLENKSSDNKNEISRTGSVNVVVDNMMFKNIKENCGSECHDNGPQKANLEMYDVTGGKNKLFYKQNNFEFDLKHGEKEKIDISKSIIEYVDEVYKDEYEVVSIRIKANIPYYNGEVDFSGNEKYQDNSLNQVVSYFPERPNISLMKCNFAGASEVGQAENDIIKSCVGHYPNNPSTISEKGMQAYHFVMYRFLPAPMPDYGIESFGKNKYDPDYFNQVLQKSEPITKEGGEENFIFKKSGNKKVERGRYIPTGADFQFSVKEKLSDGQKGKTIASGTIKYEIPDYCYVEDQLDIKSQYGCGEIMFFAPNSSTADITDVNKKPEDYKGKVEYPLGGEGKAKTKIPYINPGLYEFELKADEKFEYRYQTNDAQHEEYYWSNVKK